MKKIINGKLYNSETAKRIANYSYSYPGDFHHLSETLYQKRTGEFFLLGESGPCGKYSEATGNNNWSGGTRIVPLDREEARKWMEEYASADDYINVFGEPEE